MGITIKSNDECEGKSHRLSFSIDLNLIQKALFPIKSIYRFTEEHNSTFISTKYLWITFILGCIGAIKAPSHFDARRKYTFKKVEEKVCTAGWGYLMEDTFDIETTFGAMDISNNGRKVRGHGEGRWIQKMAYGTNAVGNGCNIWDLYIQYDVKAYSRASSLVNFPGAETMIGVIDENWIGKDSLDVKFKELNIFPGAANKAIKSLAVFTADGTPFHAGAWGNITGEYPMIVRETGERIRMILDMDSGTLSFRWKWGVLQNEILENVDIYSKWKLMVLAKHQESIVIEY